MFRCSLLWMAIGIFLLPVGATGQPQPTAGALPNIVLIVADCLRTDHLTASQNGQLLLPYVNEAIANGVWFRNAVSPSSWTSTSISSILTSMDVDTHQDYQNRDTLSSGLETMAEYLKAYGYRTACVQMNGNLISQLGFSQGFDSYDQIAGTLAEDATTQALQRISGVAQPFFLYVHYVATHVPFRAPTSYRTLMGYPPAGLATSEKTVIENYLYEYYYDHLDYQIGLKSTRTYPPFSNTGHEALWQVCDAAARYTDDQVVRLMSAVNARNPNPYFIFIADHGDHFLEHGWLGHSMTLYEELVRVPLVLTGPGLTPSITDVNVSTLDILPTLAALLALPARPWWQGQSLFAPRDPAGPTFAYTQGQYAPYNVNLEMVRWGSWKLIYDRNVQTVMLFDYVDDPQENTDVAGDNPDVVQLLKAMLDARRLVDGRTRPAEGNVSTTPGGFFELNTPLKLSAPLGQEYQWLKDGVYLVEEWPHVTGVVSRDLLITPAAAADLGRYECVYRDASRRLRITTPYTLSLLAAHTVPVAGKPGLALLISLLILAAATHARTRENSRG